MVGQTSREGTMKGLLTRGGRAEFKQYAGQDRSRGNGRPRNDRWRDNKNDKNKLEEKDKDKRELGDVLVISGGLVHGGTDQHKVIYPHDDPLVVSITIANWKVRRVLVDGGSSANIMFIDAFHKMHLDNRDLRGVNYEVTGFDGLGMIPDGIIELSVQVGEGAQARNMRA
ncbi:uncharacterized protein LOC110698168 [Chenopodium quinoa]|uniref:uncharacterized protein LOC110698168 n=1 Tax=Chenopodium quinoa TaxID=63459 RepID=UPI000B77476D|nr:uncharacterized protein LOC110698168 [Chenopodium quinoa]